MPKRSIGLGTVLCTLLVLTGCVVVSHDEHTSCKEMGLIRHVVLFQWKADTPPAKVAEIENAFRTLPKKIDAVADFEWGTDMSVEGLAQGFTHCFFVSFESEEDREAYLPHPAHKAFVDLMKPHMEKVLVIDYIAGK